MAFSMFFLASLRSSAGDANSLAPEDEDIPLERREGFIDILSA